MNLNCLDKFVFLVDKLNENYHLFINYLIASLQFISIKTFFFASFSACFILGSNSFQKVSGNNNKRRTQNPIFFKTNYKRKMYIFYCTFLCSHINTSHFYMNISSQQGIKIEPLLNNKYIKFNVSIFKEEN